jgi:hypothetical protein
MLQGIRHRNFFKTNDSLVKMFVQGHKHAAIVRNRSELIGGNPPFRSKVMAPLTLSFKALLRKQITKNCSKNRKNKRKTRKVAKGQKGLKIHNFISFWATFFAFGRKQSCLPKA